MSVSVKYSCQGLSFFIDFLDHLEAKEILKSYFPKNILFRSNKQNSKFEYINFHGLLIPGDTNQLTELQGMLIKINLEKFVQDKKRRLQVN